MKEKIKIILAILITAILSIGTTATALLVTRAENITLDSDKTDKTNVAAALGELYERTESYCPEGWTCAPTPKCIRATTLHTEICNQTGTSYCSANGSIGNGNTIKYGNTTTTEGILNTGDAFDCDVDGTGYNQRFYYVSDLYAGGTEGSETWDTNTAVLIYYSNTIKSGTTVTASNTRVSAYNSANINYEGPVSLIEHIPSKEQWTNLSINESRQIRTETGSTTTNNGGNAIIFSRYTNKAARLLTTQELNRGCGLTTSTMTTTGSLDQAKCRFLIENTLYTITSSTAGYWLETPLASTDIDAWNVNGGLRFVGDYSTYHNDFIGVRPVIEVPKAFIEY